MEIEPGTLARNIKQLREKLGKNQEQFAADLGIARPTISNWEKGKVLPTTEQLFRLVTTYSISIDELVGLNLSAEIWAVPDTSSLINRPRIINELSRKFNYVAIPRTVINELNHLKDQKNNYVSNRARLAMNSISNEHKKEGSNILFVEEVSNKDVNDDRIVDIARDLARKHTNACFYVINRDIYFSLQKDEPGIVFMSMNEYDRMFGDKNATYDYDRSVQFFNAVKGKSVEKASKAYAKGIVDPNQMNAEKGFTPLIQAVRNKDYAMVEYLLSLPDVDLNRVDESKYCLPAVSHAIQINDLKIVKMLIEAGCDVNCGSTGKNYGNTPLMIAAWHGRDDLVEALIEAGACLNQQDANGFTPLIKACLKGHPSSAKIILSQDKTDIDIRDREGKTALDWAYASNDLELKNLFKGKS
ncbi:MAG: ankyrin repeat domain-containing protein [Candidatus Methanomethylophilaceae archaeon]|nr:ankyrin repeat domain-containing protein [Candidatus Methanomethylophilaceae archaeon]